MKFLKKTILSISLFLLCTIALLYLFGYGYVLKGIEVVYFTGHTSAYIDDYSHFDNRVITKSENPIPWQLHQEYNSIAATDRLKTINKELGTIAYLIIKNDSIWYETYADGYGKTSKTNSFSMAKSLVTLMLGKAIMNGEIKGLQQPVGDFIPEFSTGLASQLTVGDLSSMASGLNWDESYKSPFSVTARAYLGTDLRKIMLGLEVVNKPGQEFEYLSGNTQLLGMVIEKATGKTLTAYMTQHFWRPMGMEEDALWQLDSEESGLEKAYCCVSSNARDFARFGSLLNHKGAFGKSQLLPRSFVEKITKAKYDNGEMYGYGVWLSNYLGKEISVMRGILGQYVISIPEDNLIIVRLGHKLGEYLPGESFREDFYVYIDEAYEMLAQQNK